MAFFNSILHKLGLGRDEPSANAQPTADPVPARSEMPGQGESVPQTPTPISQVDVVAKLDGLAAAHAQKLN